MEAFNKFIESTEAISQYMSLESCLSRWFKDADFGSIKRENVAEFLTYGFWYTTREDLAHRGLRHVPDQLVEAVEAAWKLKFPPGYNPNISFMAHLWEPLRHHTRPLMFYLALEVITYLKHIALLRMGFTSTTIHGFRVYHNLHTHPPCTPHLPILFLHGIGLGLTPYTFFIHLLTATPNPIIALECRHLSMLLNSTNPAVDTVANAAAAALQSLDVQSACVVGHSYGTFTASRLLQLHPSLVHSMVLIDPVCFCMFTGHLIKNFVYRDPDMSEGLTTFLLNLSTWVVARDVHSAAAVSRGFHWSLLNLWPDQLPDSCIVVLAEKDLLVPVNEIRTMITQETKTDLMWHPELAHADFLADVAWQKEIVQRLVAMLRAEEASNTMHGRHDSASSCMFQNGVTGWGSEKATAASSSYSTRAGCA